MAAATQQKTVPLGLDSTLWPSLAPQPTRTWASVTATPPCAGSQVYQYPMAARELPTSLHNASRPAVAKVDVAKRRSAPGLLKASIAAAAQKREEAQRKEREGTRMNELDRVKDLACERDFRDKTKEERRAVAEEWAWNEMIEGCKRHMEEGRDAVLEHVRAVNGKMGFQRGGMRFRRGFEGRSRFSSIG